MKWMILAIIILLIILFFTSVKIKIEYKKVENDDDLYIEAGIWFGLITLKFRIPVVKLQSWIQGLQVERKVAPAPAASHGLARNKSRFTPRELLRYLEKVYRWKLKVHDFQLIVKKTLKKVRCEQWEWYTRIGVGDAAATGMIVGVVWGVKSTLSGFLSKYLTLRTLPRFQVVPAFQSQVIDVRFLCILRFRIGYAIIAGTRMLFNLRKGREGLWQSTLFRA